MGIKIINFYMNNFKKYFILSFSFALVFILNINLAKAEEAPIIDTTAPVISLLGENNISINVGDLYTDAGATASDDIDGDISSNISITNLVNTAIAGSYTVTYNVSDAAGNSATPIVRNVVVVEVPSIVNETFIIRNNDSLIWQGTINLPEAGTISISDNTGASHSINSRSVLGVLYLADQTNENFSISNLEYFSSFGSFYLKCIAPVGSSELCDNWQYSVGSTTPSQSIDTTILSGNETIGIFFGSPHRLVVEAKSIEVNQPFLVKAQKYNYSDNSWLALSGVSVGITLPNPADPWNPIVVSTKPVDALGEADFILSDVNNYSLGIVEDYYYPTYELSTYLRATGGVDPIKEEKLIKKVFNIEAAISFLNNNQKANGSFLDSDLYTDWAAIALSGAKINDNTKNLLLAYLKNSKLGSSLTDNERRTMSLLALGQNPYNFNNENYIESITKEFDKEQFGDKDLINDDVFAIIPLLKAGYTSGDEMIVSSSSYIIRKQEDNGSWNNSLDLTAATIEALSLVNLPKDSQAIMRARNYILENQKADGGFDSVFSTSWAEQARLSLKEEWIKNNNTPLDYLASKQEDDGALLLKQETEANRIWATSYALTAALGKTWFDILSSVEKPVVVLENVLEPTNAIELNNNLDIKEVKEEKIIEEKSKDKIKEEKLTKKVFTEALKQEITPSQEIKEDLQNTINEPINKEEDNKDNKKALMIFTGLFIIVGGIIVARFWI